MGQEITLEMLALAHNARESARAYQVSYRRRAKSKGQSNVSHVEPAQW
jgi:hypothetical protein